MTCWAAGCPTYGDYLLACVLGVEPSLTARFQRRFTETWFANLSKTTFAPSLAFRRGASAFHLWQAGSEDEGNHPHHQQLPECLTDRLHKSPLNTGGVLMPRSKLDFVGSGQFVKMRLASCGDVLRSEPVPEKAPRYKAMPIPTEPYVSART